MRRNLCALLACCMLLSLLPARAGAAGTELPSAVEAAVEPGLNGGGLLPQPDEVRLMDADSDKVDEILGIIRQAAENWDGSTAEQEVSIPGEGYTADEMMSKMKQAADRFNSLPDMFYAFCASRGYRGTYYYVILQFKTEFTRADITAFYNKADEILAQVDSGWTDVQKALWLHDYLVTHIEYDNSLTKYTAYDGLIGGECVCQGYTDAYKYLTERTGLQCEVVSSDLINHAWNMIWVDGRSYYVDCTWDDPGNMSADTCEHENFLIGRDDLVQTGHVSSDNRVDWTDGTQSLYSSGLAAETYADSWWKGCESAIPHAGSKWAYCDAETGGIFVRDFSTGTDSSLSSVSEDWYVWGSDSSYWTKRYVRLCSDGESFYASGPTDIYKISPDGSKEVFYTLTAGEQAQGYIYGIRIEDNALIYRLYTDSYRDSFVYSGSIPVEIHTGGGGPAAPACTVSGVRLSGGSVDVQAANVPGGAAVWAAVYSASGQMLWSDCVNTDSAQSTFQHSFSVSVTGAEARAVILDAGSLAPLCAPKRSGA